MEGRKHFLINDFTAGVGFRNSLNQLGRIKALRAKHCNGITDTRHEISHLRWSPRTLALRINAVQCFYTPTPFDAYLLAKSFCPSRERMHTPTPVIQNTGKMFYRRPQTFCPSSPPRRGGSISPASLIINRIFPASVFFPGQQVPILPPLQLCFLPIPF